MSVCLCVCVRVCLHCLQVKEEFITDRDDMVRRNIRDGDPFMSTTPSWRFRKAEYEPYTPSLAPGGFMRGSRGMCTAHRCDTHARESAQKPQARTHTCLNALAHYYSHIHEDQGACLGHAPRACRVAPRTQTHRHTHSATSCTVAHVCSFACSSYSHRFSLVQGEEGVQGALQGDDGGRA